MGGRRAKFDDDRDYELARYRTEQRYDLARRTLPPAVKIMSYGVPVAASTTVALALADKDTTIGITLSVTFTLTIAIGAGALALYRRVRSQKKELERMRRRNDLLEVRLKRLQGGSE